MVYRMFGELRKYVGYQRVMQVYRYTNEYASLVNPVNILIVDGLVYYRQNILRNLIYLSSK